MAVFDRELAELKQPHPTQKLDPFKGVKKLPVQEYFTAGPRTIVLGATGCMYVANTTYYSTSWVVPWMHTQLGSAGSAALGAAAALKALMRKGKMKDEPINVIAFCGDGGGADMGISAISATLTHPDYNCLILMYDNESYANTDIQLSGSTPWGAHTTFSTPGPAKRIMHHRWKKNMAGVMAAGHPTRRHVATICMSYGLHGMNAIRKALSIGGAAFVFSLDPRPPGWGYDPHLSPEFWEVAGEKGV